MVSLQLIQQYYTKVERVIQYGGSKNESALRFAFQTLIEQYCAVKNLELIGDLEYKTKYGTIVYPDGTLKDALRQDWGYWESKDEYDVLDEEIEKKLDKGYPTTNILFEDGQIAVLIQNGQEIDRAEFNSPSALHSIITAFVSYEPKEVQDFRGAIEKFKETLPDLTTELRQLIEEQASSNPQFAQARADFLELCRESINPYIVLEDIREMMIQHVLTEDIFITVFDESQFHQENNIAHELSKVIQTFFKGTIRRNILNKVDAYSKIIKAAASNIYDHHEKQRFLKVVYENFYKAYNPAGADRLGIVYTPNEIVHFMVESTDYLVDKHFGRFLSDKNVEILDPAAGTGTYITELIEYIPENLLPYKYENEIHCNEVAILPYYIANLNIEYTYAQKMNAYSEFENICFVDTLDNLGFGYTGKQAKFIAITAENLDRIRNQNERKISVIIGNPPYNANQLNENENNKNREYPEVDKRIKETYVNNSTAQKTKLYDMYSRFIRWATDRLDDNGILSFITNRSFIDAKTYDGFRKVVGDEFTDIYLVDLGGDVRKNPKLSGPRHNVFAIQTGVAISFFIKKESKESHHAHIYYTRRPEIETAREKLRFLAATKFQDLSFEHIQPDKYNNWINIAQNDWSDLVPVAAKIIKLAKTGEQKAIFKLFSLGIATNRDEWVYDFDSDNLQRKVKFFCQLYESEKVRWNSSDKQTAVNDFVDRTIKWTSELEAHLVKGSKLIYGSEYIKPSLYRPFVLKLLYFDRTIVHRLYLQDEIFRIAGDDDNVVICFSGLSSSKTFQCIATKYVPSLDLLEKTQCLPLFRYNKFGNRVDNITDWSLSQFQEHYKDTSISRKAIFHYVYAVLNNPAYREKYEINLKQELPHIPFYYEFWQWESLGRQLMDLHLNFETAIPHPLKRVDKTPNSNKMNTKPKAKLKVDKTAHTIELDTITTLKDIPPVVWDYKLGNRSALEWILEYYKERRPSDPTILEKFNTYRFADYKEEVIDLLERVCTVSINTMEIIEEMRSISS